jgi:hypothetical protein
MAAPAVSAPIVSNVPVLILEGTFDAATAPEWVDLITRDLKNSQFVAFPSRATRSSASPRARSWALLDNPTKPVDFRAARTTLTFTR